ncbi:CRISPR-associated helicase Cas3' [Chamaesiphon sp. VAR_48_metabat_135_sub]|uniref:CRISPR-associated helicase Cas3' n=1 Tax=Chamaesiphon sp. VAR_48_metabat_135_sub TaxID=2964699 RepID=UPI00286AD0C8|nr:CRISPR-associated helicase Cas3' [Chamaesiphon sp. VAR_48_metabat_135_sub]
MTERFWAKTGDAKFENGSPQYHPVICHLADTASVAMEIVRNYLSQSAIDRLEIGLGLQGESLIRFCGFIAGSHDLGKVSPAFQFQVSEVGKALVGDNIYSVWHDYSAEIKRGKTPHGIVTAKTLPEFLIELGIEKSLSKKLAKIVGGHHGFFPSNKDIQDLDDLLAGTKEGSAWQRFSHDIFIQLRDFVGLTESDLPSQCNNAAAMLIAGLTTVSDWIASNPDEKTGFPYANDRLFAEYAIELPAKARQALTAIGWTKIAPGKPLTFGQLFPQNPIPRHLQDAAIELSEHLQPPCLVLVEASMGEGKTEAALYLADRLQHQAGAGGFYIGLPTQATSNAMWKRVQSFLGQRYPQQVVNLTLSHSAAALKPEYQETVCRLDQVYDEDGRVAAGEWHTARKRTMLSPYGVGTIDQALMGAVRSRHQFVRLFGLAGRTVILDEIHAYDLYTGTLLERFLEWLALLGSPAIALSATLPASTRARLVNAYARGCGMVEPELPPAEYPRITALTFEGAIVKSFPASNHVTRSLDLNWVDEENWGAELASKLSDGGCATVICSTVARAQAVFDRLREYFLPTELGLFHGRFLFVDRERIEADCLDKFGKDSKNRPKKFVLVATQVIEQSLDVDFDLMISDIAPIDLLLQRSGRLHRHPERKATRPSQVQEPTLWIIKPQLNEHQHIDFDAAGFIYDRHVLLRTWFTLRALNTIQLPDLMDELIESVYDLEMAIPDSLTSIEQTDWQTSLTDYLQDCQEQKTLAQRVYLPPARQDAKPEHFTRQGEEDDESAIAAMTRLGETSVTTIFISQTEEKRLISSKPPNLAQIRELLGCSTRISKRGLVNALMAQQNPPAWKSALLRNCRYVVVDDGGIARIGEWELELDPLKGVVITKISES